MKRFVLVLMAAAMLLTFVLPVLGQDAAVSGTGKFEGEGFDTPEEAVKAYVEAFSRNDAAAAAAAFAIESSVDHRDALQTAESLMLFNPYNNINNVPNDNDWIRDIKIAKRYAEVMGYFYNQYVTYTLENGLEPAQNLAHPIRTVGEMDEISALLQNEERALFLKDIRFVECLDPVKNGVLNQNSQWVNLTRQTVTYAAEDYTALGAHIMIGGHHGLLFFDCVRYDGRWFLQSLGGYLSYAFGLDSYQAGLLILSEQEYAGLIGQYTGTPDADPLALYESHLESELTGTYWTLTEMTGAANAQYTVVKSPEELADHPDDMALYGQLHFTRWGYILRTKETPQPDPEARLKDTSHYGLWAEENGVLEVSDFDEAEKIVLFGSKIMVFLRDGSAAVFSISQ